MSVPAIVIDSEAGELVAIEVTRREFPEASDYSDGNSVYTTVRVSIGAFCREYEALLRSIEFASFRGELTRLQADLKGSVAFAPLELC